MLINAKLHLYVENLSEDLNQTPLQRYNPQHHSVILANSTNTVQLYENYIEPIKGIMSIDY